MNRHLTRAAYSLAACIVDALVRAQPNCTQCGATHVGAARVAPRQLLRWQHGGLRALRGSLRAPLTAGTERSGARARHLRRTRRPRHVSPAPRAPLALLWNSRSSLGARVLLAASARWAVQTFFESRHGYRNPITRRSPAVRTGAVGPTGSPSGSSSLRSHGLSTPSPVMPG